MSFNIKRKLKNLEGETFYTITGVPYTYHFVADNVIQTDRANRNIPLSDFQKSIDFSPSKPSQLPDYINGRSYIFGIITDSRFING